jgi:hypothetical protein
MHLWLTLEKNPSFFVKKSRAASSFGQIASIKVAWRLGGSGDQQMLRPSATGCRCALRWFLRGPSASGFLWFSYITMQTYTDWILEVRKTVVAFLIYHI